MAGATVRRMSDEQNEQSAETTEPTIDAPEAQAVSAEASADTSAEASDSQPAEEQASEEPAADAQPAAEAQDAKPAKEAKPKKAEPVAPREKSTAPPTDKPFLLVTAVVDSGVRAASATLSHGDAMETALEAAAGQEHSGVDLVELAISPAPFGALRRALKLSDDVVALYDIFPLASHLGDEVRKVAGQFLAAEAVWTLEEQGLLGGVPLNARLDLPRGWERDPKLVHERLVDAGALNLSNQGIETFKAVKSSWDQKRTAN